jgi:hypothetical protein
MITRYAPGMPRPGRVGVELKRLAAEQVYVYEDERLRLTIPVPSVEVFEAVVRELERLGPDVADIHEYVTILARAFWLLHQRPRRRGWFRRHTLREPGDDEALALLARAVPRADVIITSLRDALLGLVEYVLGKKKEGRAAPTSTSGASAWRSRSTTALTRYTAKKVGRAKAGPRSTCIGRSGSSSRRTCRRERLNFPWRSLRRSRRPPLVTSTWAGAR